MGSQCVHHEFDSNEPRDPVAQRILGILEACGQTPLTITSLAQSTGLAKSTVHRMCWKLADLGFLSQEDGKFAVGSKIAALGSSSTVYKRLRTAAIPYLVELQHVAGASQLAVLNGSHSLVLDGIYTRQLRAHHLLGAAMPLHCTATGKALLAKAEADEREHLLNSISFKFFTRRTIIQVGRLRTELEQIAQTGFATSIEEFQPGIVAVAAAFRVGDISIAAVGTLGNSTDSAVLRSATHVMAAARELGRALNSKRVRY